MGDHNLAAILSGLGKPAKRLALRGAPAGATIVPALSFQDPATLERAIAAANGRYGGTAGPRVLAAQWQKRYCDALINGPLAAMTGAGIGLPVALDRASFEVKAGWPQALVVADPAEVVIYSPRLPRPIAAGQGRTVASIESLHEAVVPDLLRHLAAINDRLREVASLSPKVAWGNAGNACASVFDRLTDAGLPECVVGADRRLLLDVPESPYHPGPNPLRDPVRYLAPSTPGSSPFRVRRTCCLRYQIPAIEMCSSCPLAFREARVAASAR